jgi:putative heme transporter
VTARVWVLVFVVVVAFGGLWTATHGVAGVAWADVGVALRGVTAWQLLRLTLVWFGGLAIYSTVLAAALPGVGVRRSLLLNLSGSAVANVVPLGGAVATALNWRMVRSWGHSDVAFVTFCVLTNALDVLSKLLLPAVGVAALVAVSVHVPTLLWLVAGCCLVVALVVVLLHAHLVGHGGGPAGSPHRRVAAVRLRLHESATRIHAVLTGGWSRLLPGSVCYVAAQVLLLWLCLRAVGLDPSLGVVLMAAAVERIGSLVPVTPAGTGVAEIGAVAWLVAAGLDPASVVAGVLLYRIFLVLMEIPVGGLLLGAWAWLQRGTGGRPGQVPA